VLLKRLHCFSKLPAPCLLFHTAALQKEETIYHALINNKNKW